MNSHTPITIAQPLPHLLADDHDAHVETMHKAMACFIHNLEQCLEAYLFEKISLTTYHSVRSYTPAMLEQQVADLETNEYEDFHELVQLRPENQRYRNLLTRAEALV